MNKISYLFGLAIMALIIHSCEKEQILQNGSLKIENPQYWVDEGILNFSSGEAYQKLNDRLTGMNMEEIQVWEDSLGFVSFRTIYFSVLDELEQAETEEDYNNILNNNSDVIILEDERFEPIIKQASYQNTTNRKGLFIINGIPQKATSTELLIYDNNCYSSILELSEITDKIDTWTRKDKFKGSVLLKSATYCTSTINQTGASVDDKWCYAEYSVKTTPYTESGGDINRCYEVTCISYAYKKNLFGKPVLYNSLHACFDLECVVEAPYSYYDFTCGCTINTTQDATINYSTNGQTVTSSTTKTQPWFNGKRIGDYKLNTPLPDPVFKRVKGNFWISGTTNPNPPYDHEDARIDCGYGY